MSACKTEIIYQNKDFIFTKCMDCSRMGLMYHQVMIGFDEINFSAFIRYLKQLDFETYKYPCIDGIDRVIIETYHQDIQFSFSEEEFYTLKTGVIEANEQLQLIEMIRKL
ncbi:DUF6686 family protein [Cyclobacterium amurskyense]|uniref:DUF6686 family protein n=1 Tax=Cyclobacterium amurskyense TaxID=320787 RepID=UPI0030DC28AA|tara:strand:+ start:4095 stop:4424 length:330 start_codon:yes stop_codon:yes gene_type:complete